jgi:exopolyphosphatase/pppGpp-phosphohydrolase
VSSDKKISDDNQSGEDPADRSPGTEKSGKDFSPEPLPLEDLYHIYGIERSHADNVARNALEIFDILNSIHGLHPEMRNLVEIAALVHDTGMATDFENHHKAGKVILSLHPPSELPERLWPVVAWTAFLHKKRIGNEKLEKLKEKDFGKMPEDLQELTLRVAAIVRLADALDYSRMESRLGKVTFGKRSIKFEIEGQGAANDAERMEKKGDLWHLLYNTKLEFRPAPKK